MAMMLKSSYDAVCWTQFMKDCGVDIELRTWPNVGPVEDIEYALVWKPEPGDLKRYPNLKAIFSTGAGVDHIFQDPQLPKGVPVCRILDDNQTAQMSEYAIYGVLHFHRKMAAYAQAQKDLVWQQLVRADTAATQIGVMGLGQIGVDTARKLASLGFQVRGWSRSQKTIPNVRTFNGDKQLDEFLAGSQFLICVLPLTQATTGILNAKTFAALPKGAFVINMARGGHMVDADLIAALNAGHLGGAMLDVFHTEPLDREHPFWTHPDVVVTPHIAGDLDQVACARQVAENIKRRESGQALKNVVDPGAQY